MDAARSLTDLLSFDRYFVVGANSGGDQVRDWLEKHHKEIVAFSDPDPRLQGQKRNGLEVLPVDALPEKLGQRDAVAIGTLRQCEVATLLVDELGVGLSKVFPFVNSMFSAHYERGVQAQLSQNRDRVRAFLDDEESRSYFDRTMAFYRTLDARNLQPNPRCIGHYGYDAPGANPKPGATIVDVGAYTGDTLGDFIEATGRNCHVSALEAFLPNVERLSARLEQEGLRDIVTIFHVAAVNKPGPVVISGDATIADGGAGIGSADRFCRDIVLGETLDNLFLKHFPQRIDYLKVDIEGADLDALLGAEQVLRLHRPVVAVAAYHTPEHITAIPEFLRKTLAPCRIYAGHDPAFKFHIHYIVVPIERAM